MILDDSQILKLFAENKTVPDWINKARAYHVEWKALIYGENFKDRLIKIENIESEKRAKARKQYATPIKDLNNKLCRPIDNVYTAVGGTKIYDVDEKERAKLFKIIGNLRDGKSLEKWLETYWIKDLYIVDPSGILFMEYDNSKWCKPTYKSIQSIRNYKVKGQKLDWIIFEPFKIKVKELLYRYPNMKLSLAPETDLELWRFVDDEKDRTYYLQQEQFILIPEISFKHPFGEVPGITNSNIQRLGELFKISPFDCIKEKQEEYLRDVSILNIFKFKHGFSIPWRAGMICTECHGTGKRITDSVSICPVCDGKGEILNKDVIDEIIIPINQNGETNIPNTLGGFITPDTATWDKYREEIKQAETSMFDSLWGINVERSDSGEKTATETILNAQPKINKLHEWSDLAQYMEWQITEWIGKWLFPNRTKQVCKIYYGRNYLLKDADSIFSEYQKAKAGNAPITVLDKMLIEYLTTKYKNDPQTLKEELIKKDLEYWPHYSVDEVKNIYGIKAAKHKMYFTDWWESLLETDKNKTIEQLTILRDTWMQNEIVKSTETTDKQTLSTELGVGGTQSLQLIVTDQYMNPESKKGLLKILFGLTDEQINLIIINKEKDDSSSEPL